MPNTRHLVAPELLPALELLPAFEFTPETLAFIRAGGWRDPKLKPPVLSAEQQAVACAERFVPGPMGAPDVRVLIYTPPGELSAPRPAFLHIHGGGYVLGTPEIGDGSNRSLAAEGRLPARRKPVRRSHCREWTARWR